MAKLVLFICSCIFGFVVSELVKEALEIESLIIGVEPNLLGIFAGGVDPNIAIPDAPMPSIYYKSDGTVYKLIGDASLMIGWEEQVNGGDVQTGEIPFCNADGTTDNMAVLSGGIPFQNADGSTDNIGLV